MSGDPQQNHERLKNIWNGIARRSPALARCAQFEPTPTLPIEKVAGLARARNEILTHAGAITHPEIFARWGTVPAVGLMLIGKHGSGKSTLARALATHLDSPLLEIDVPQLVLELLTHAREVTPLVDHWDEIFSDFPRTIVHFDELDFERMHETGERRAGLPAEPILEFLLRLISITASSQSVVLVGSTSYPDTTRPVFLSRRRFNRTLSVEPAFPGDHAAVLESSARMAEERAGRELFDSIDWRKIVETQKAMSPGDWVEVMHGALRAQARCEVLGDSCGLVKDADLRDEASTLAATEKAKRAHTTGGNYL